MRIRFTRFLLFACLQSVIGVAQSQPVLKLPGPPAQELLLGTWSIRVQYLATQDSPTTESGSGEEKWYPGPGGFSLVEEYREHSSKGDIEGLGVLWWDKSVAGLRVLWCENDEPSGCALMTGIGHWESDQLILTSDQELHGKKLKFKEVFSEITATSFQQTLYSGEGASELKAVVIISATRKSAFP